MRRVAAAMVLSACARVPAPVAAPRAAPVARVATQEVEVTPSPWRALVRGGLPAAIRDVGALDGGAAIVAAGSAMLVARGEGHFERVCEGALVPGDEPHAIEAAGDRFVALGGGDRAPVAWVSLDRGARCVRVALPSLASGAPERFPAVSVDAGVTWVWSPRGGIARSLDGGLSWTLLPSLPGVLRVFAGAGDETLVAASQGPDEGDRSVASHRTRILRLDESVGADARWRVVAEDRLRPAAASRTADGVTHIVDGEGLLDVDASLRAAAGPWIPWSRSASDAPRIIVAADPGRFFASAERQLFRVDARGAHPLGTLPGERRVRCIDAAADGTLWAADERTLWRGDFEGRWQEETRLPWTAPPVAAAVRGARIAVATNDGGMAFSEDDGATWRSGRLPAGVGGALAMAFNDRGALLVLGVRAAAIGDARRMVQVDAPATEGALAEAPAVFAAGDRWVVVRGGVWTSDDEGAHWTPRFGNDFQRAPERGGAPQAVLDVALVGARALLLDANHDLWRSDDAGAAWRPVTEASTSPIATRNPWGAGRSFLTWDGGARVAVLGRNALATSDDGGRTWTTRDMNVLASAVAMDRGGRVVLAAERVWSAPRLCVRGEGATLLAGDPDGFPLAREACAHRGSLVAFDRAGGDAMVLGANGVAWRAPLDALYEPEAPTVL